MGSVQLDLSDGPHEDLTLLLSICRDFHYTNGDGDLEGINTDLISTDAAQWPDDHFHMPNLPSFMVPKPIR